MKNLAEASITSTTSTTTTNATNASTNGAPDDCSNDVNSSSNDLKLLKFDDKINENNGTNSFSLPRGDRTIKSLLNAFNRETNVFRNIKTTTSLLNTNHSNGNNVISVLSSAASAVISSTSNTVNNQCLRSFIDINRNFELNCNNNNNNNNNNNSCGVGNESLRKYSCNSCNRFYNDAEKLRRHVNNTHNKEKKFECNVCNKRFAYKHILQEHQNLHYGLKPHACETCGKSFAARSNLIQHNRRHKFVTESLINRDYESDEQTVRINPITTVVKTRRRLETIRPICQVCPKNNTKEVFDIEKVNKTETNCLDAAMNTAFNFDKENNKDASCVDDKFTQKANNLIFMPSNELTPISNDNQLLLNKNESNCNIPNTNNTNNYFDPNLLLSSPKFQQQLQQQQSQNRSKVQIDITTNEMPNSTFSMNLDELLSRFEAQDKLFRCNYCGIIFMERGMYFLHIALHSNNPWECSICHKIMQDKNEFTLHFVNQKHTN